LRKEFSAIPAHGQIQSFLNAMGWGVTEKALRFLDGSMGMADVAGTEVVVNGFLLWNGGIALTQDVLKEMEELVQGSSFANGNVEDLVESSRIVSCGGEEISLDDVVDVTEIATGLAIAINVNRLTLKECGDPTWNDRGVSACRVLAWAEDIEIAKADGVQIVRAGEDASVNFVHGLCGGVGRKGFSDVFFNFGERWKVAIHGTARCVDEPLDFGVAGSDEHVEEAGHIGVMGANWIGQRARDGAQRRLVQNVIDISAESLTGGQVANVAFNNACTSPFARADIGADLVEILLVTRGKVVEAKDELVELKKGFENIRAYKAGDTRDQPGAGSSAESGL